MTASKTIALALAALCYLTSSAQTTRLQVENPIDVSFLPVFIGSPASVEGVDTMTVALQDNVGPADVRLEIDGYNSKTVYFASLRPRQVQTLTAYIPYSVYGPASYNLTAKIHGNGNRSSDRDYFDHENLAGTGFGIRDSNEIQVLKLSVRGKGLSLDKQENSTATQGPSSGGLGSVAPFVGSVAAAPKRPIAYRRFRCVMLGAGCEKLSDGAVTALKDYVLEGGVVSMRLPMTDSRWKGFAPSAHGAQRNGFGLVFLFAEPNSSAIESSPLDQHDLKTILGQTDPVALTSSLRTGSSQNQVMYPSSDSEADPFATTLPSFGKILGLLAGYFLAVVPINFLILKRLRRPELTWVTAPILAVLFAGILFRGTKSLYKAPISTATHGTLVLQQGVDEGMFEGESDLFFPHAGSISLNLKNVDATGVWLDNPQDGYMPNNGVETPLVFDSGTLDIPSLQSPNLAFRQLKLSARVPVKDWIVFHKGPSANGVTPVYVENKSPYAVTDATFYVGPLSEKIGDLPPGGSAEMDTVPTPQISKTTYSIDSAYTPLQSQNILQGQNRVFLAGTMNALPVGPQIGTRINSRTSIEVAAFPSADLDIKL